MPDRPNLLWILTTQWRASALGCAGDPNARTPHLDALAGGGRNFSQAVTPHPFGPFARAAMLTGVPSPENGVRDYFDPLPAGARTIAHDLNERGYLTAFFGKWHLARRDPAAPLVGDTHARMVIPESARGGFGFFEGFESGFLLNDPWLHGTRLPEPQRFTGYQSDVLCERAAGWWREQRRKSEANLFAVVSLEPPHPPYDVPAAGVPPRDAATLQLVANVPPGGEVAARARRELAGYYAHLEATDRAIGRLLQQVEDTNTLVVVTSVHGDMHGAHGLFRKGWPHEESVRVPLLVRGPGVGAGVDAAAISLVDLRAYTRAWADSAPVPASPTQARVSMPSVVKLRHQCDCVWRGVRTKDRKLILNEDGSPWLLFDLARDPLEMSNLVDDPAYADDIKSLGAALR